MKTVVNLVPAALAALALALGSLVLAGCGPATPDPTNLNTENPPTSTSTPESLSMTGWDDFSAQALGNPAGQITLSKELADGPVVLVFYRGHWCKACRTQLGELQGNIREFDMRGAQLVAVSADTLEESRPLVEEQGLQFPVVSDADLEIIDAYGVREEGEEFARPTTLVIAPDGTILYKKVGESVSDRPDIQELLQALDEPAAEPEGNVDVDELESDVVEEKEEVVDEPPEE